jgi:hypothetical protein
MWCDRRVSRPCRRCLVPAATAALLLCRWRWRPGRAGPRTGSPAACSSFSQRRVGEAEGRRSGQRGHSLIAATVAAGDINISICQLFYHSYLTLRRRTLGPRFCSEKDFVRGIAPSWDAPRATCMYRVQVPNSETMASACRQARRWKCRSVMVNVFRLMVGRGRTSESGPSGVPGSSN